jgi:flagellar basal body-associated protein FliL
MQPSASPSASASAPPDSRNRLLSILAIVAAILLAVGGVVGYLIGSAAVGHATLRVNVENRLASNVTAQVTVNSRLVATLTIPSGQTMSVDVAVAFATANGALFDVEATTAAGMRDSSTPFVNTPGIYVVSLRIG